MITLTPAELELRDFLAEIAVGANGGEHKDHTVTYGQIAEALDPDNELTWKQGHPRYSRVVTARGRHCVSAAPRRLLPLALMRRGAGGGSRARAGWRSTA